VTPFAEPSALAPRRIEPLCQSSGLARRPPLSRRRALKRRVRESNPQDPKVTLVFETSALAVRPTLLIWTAEGIEPSFPGCRPGVFPLDDAPFSFHIAGRARTFTLGLRRAALFRLSYRNTLHNMWSRQDSNLHEAVSETAASANWATEPPFHTLLTTVPEPAEFSHPPRMHRVGVEPT
jgi:hypothetical protein